MYYDYTFPAHLDFGQCTNINSLKELAHPFYFRDLANLPVSNRVTSYQSTHAAPNVSICSGCDMRACSDLDHLTLPLVSLQASDGRKHILNISMAPVFPLNFGDGSDIAGAKGIDAGWQQDQDRKGDEQQVFG